MAVIGAPCAEDSRVGETLSNASSVKGVGRHQPEQGLLNMKCGCPDSYQVHRATASQANGRTVHASDLCILVMCLLAPACWASPVAVVVDRTGDVSIEALGASRQVASLETLNVGARVTLVNHGRLVVLFMPSGHEFTVMAPSRVEINDAELTLLSGTAPILRIPKAGGEVRLRPDRVEQGGIVLRGTAPVSSPPDSALSEEIDRRRPEPGASWASRVAFALWLDDVGAKMESRQAWRTLALERPEDMAVARRGR
jgi:hypothetical protein